MTVTLSNSLGKFVSLSVIRVQVAVQVARIIFLAYVGGLLENLKKKIQNFQIFEKFQRFLFFGMSYRANSKK